MSKMTCDKCGRERPTEALERVDRYRANIPEDGRLGWYFACWERCVIRMISILLYVLALR